MAENEELDILKNSKWRPFINELRGGRSLNDEVVLPEFDFALVSTLQRVFKLLPVKELITACINGHVTEVERIRKQHRQQRDRAETFADHIVRVCSPGILFRDAVDRVLHGACVRIIDQAALRVVPSDNFPTLDAYREASGILLFKMETRISQLVDRIVEHPSKIRQQRRSKEALNERADQQLRWSVVNRKETDPEQDNADSVWTGD